MYMHIAVCILSPPKIMHLQLVQRLPINKQRRGEAFKGRWKRLLELKTQHFTREQENVTFSHVLYQYSQEHIYGIAWSCRFTIE